MQNNAIMSNNKLYLHYKEHTVYGSNLTKDSIEKFKVKKFNKFVFL